MTLGRTQCFLLAGLSGILLNLCFPIAGPMRPPGSTLWGFVGATPLLFALIKRKSRAADENASQAASRPLRASFLTGWVFGVVWYAVNCYWIYQTMFLYGGLPAPVSAGILLLYSLIMGLYYGLFGWLTGFVRETTGSAGAPLVLAPFLWTAIDLLGAHLIKVPWDQLGYSQVDNFLLLRLAPWTGTYGITFLLLAVSAVVTFGLLRGLRGLRWSAGGGAAAVLLWLAGTHLHPAAAPTAATAVMLQENLDVQKDNMWAGTVWNPRTGKYDDLWDVNMDRNRVASEESCTAYLAGMPETGAAPITPKCDGTHAQLILWPEAPAPITEHDSRFRAVVERMTKESGAAAIIGNAAGDVHDRHVDLYNAASVFGADGALVGRYEKIHLVPWGEYVPFKQIFGFAHSLTHNAGRFTHGSRRMVFRLNGRRYGVFICYESIFADEIRRFVVNGAEVLVNLSDDGWYGDTSAPWQHLNMARMRAVENQRWILRDTNTGVTAAIDPWGRITQSTQRHVFTSLAVQYGFRDDLSFYTRYGDVFALLCGILSIASLARCVRVRIDRRRRTVA